MIASMNICLQKNYKIDRQNSFKLKMLSEVPDQSSFFIHKKLTTGQGLIIEF